MSRTFHHGERKIRIKGVRKDSPDLRRLARALIALVEAGAEAEAEAEEKGRRAGESENLPTDDPDNSIARGAGSAA